MAKSKEKDTVVLDLFGKIPGEIKAISLKNLELVKAIAGLKRSCDITKSSMIAEISNEMVDGKKKFSNSELRETEFNTRIANNKEYNDALNVLKTYEDSMTLNNIEVTYLDRMFRLYEMVLK